MRKETEIPSLDGAIQAGGEPLRSLYRSARDDGDGGGSLGSYHRPGMAPQPFGIPDLAPGNDAWPATRLQSSEGAEKGAQPSENTHARLKLRGSPRSGATLTSS